MSNPKTDFVFSLNQKPGIWRDWTPNAAPGYIDGANVRFLHGRPKKIGGRRQIAAIGLTPNNTYFSMNGEPTSGDADNVAKAGPIRQIKIYPYDNKYIVVVCTDIIGDTDGIDTVDPSTTLTPTGVWIGVTSDAFATTVQLSPVRFQRYYQQSPTDPNTNVVVQFKPGAYNWTVSIFGTTSGGEGIDSPTARNVSVLSALGLVMHAEDTLKDPNGTTNSYVYFAKLSDMLNLDDERNYVADPNMVDVAPSTPKKASRKYVYAPMMYPITTMPIGGVTATGNPYVVPVTNDPNAIYGTSDVWVSGGAIAVGPFIFAYGNNGLIRTCAANTPNWWFNMNNKYYVYNTLNGTNDANVDNYKFIASQGVTTGADMGAFFWTSNSVVSVRYIGSPAFWMYSPLPASSTLMSQRSPVFHNGTFYWIGIDRFYISDGRQLREIPNRVNYNWFFKNVNYLQRGKIFGFRVPQYHEIWWVFPTLGSDEPNHAIIYNYVEETWYDTPFEMSAGTFDPSFKYPICGGGSIPTTVTTTTVSGGVPVNTEQLTADLQQLWIQDEGLNIVDSSGQYALPSHYTTNNIAFTNGAPNSGQALQGSTFITKVDRLERDGFLSSGQQLTFVTRQFPDSDDKISNIIDLDSPLVTFSNQAAGLVMLKVSVNQLDGDYFYGKPLITAKITDARR